MSYAIVGGIGLLIGLGLLIWAVRLQGKLARSEVKLAETVASLEKAADVALANANAAAQAEDTAKRALAASDELRVRLKAARESLLLCKDPGAIQQVLDAELKEEAV